MIPNFWSTKSVLQLGTVPTTLINPPPAIPPPAHGKYYWLLGICFIVTFTWIYEDGLRKVFVRAFGSVNDYTQLIAAIYYVTIYYIAYKNFVPKINFAEAPIIPSLDQVMQMIGNFVGPGTLFIATFTVLSFKYLKADPVTPKTPT